MDFQKLDAYMQSLETVFGVPSCEIAVTLGEETVFSKTYGYSDAMRKQPAAKTDLYRLFSMTKLITVIAVLQQMEQNRLCLDSLVEESGSGTVAHHGRTMPSGSHAHSSGRFADHDRRNDL